MRLELLPTFIGRNPTIVMLALSFLLLIGTTLIAEGFGVHVPKGHVYAAMAFSAVVEGLDMRARNARLRRGGRNAVKTPGPQTWRLSFA